MSDQARETAQTEHQTGFLGLIERAGNRLPDPAFIFLYLIIAMVIISVITAVMGLSALHPTQTNPDGSAVLVEARSVLSAASLQHLLVEMPEIFTGFHPLGYVLVVMLGAGVAERAGLFGTAMRAAVRDVPKMLLTPAVALVAMIAPIVGLLVGTVSGYAGGWVDIVLMRVTDIFLAFPRLVLALAFVAALGAGIENAVLAISLTAWPPYARLARAETLTIRSSDFISAIRLQGAGPLLIITKHIWPLCISSLIVRFIIRTSGTCSARPTRPISGRRGRPGSPARRGPPRRPPRRRACSETSR